MALDPFVQSKLDSITRTYKELTERLGDPDVVADPKLLMQVRSIVNCFWCIRRDLRIYKG